MKTKIQRNLERKLKKEAKAEAEAQRKKAEAQRNLEAGEERLRKAHETHADSLDRAMSWEEFVKAANLESDIQAASERTNAFQELQNIFTIKGLQQHVTEPTRGAYL